MRSNYAYSRSELDKEARRIAAEEIDKVYDKWSQDCAYHALAVCYAVLHREFGFGAARLKRLTKSINAELLVMEHGALGKEYKESDIREWLLSIGIDFEKER